MSVVRKLNETENQRIQYVGYIGYIYCRQEHFSKQMRPVHDQMSLHSWGPYILYIYIYTQGDTTDMTHMDRKKGCLKARI